MNPEFGITRFSPAKVNLTLAVGPVRPDGFHPLESIVSLLDFGDYVTLIPRSDDAIVIECETPGIPTDDTNLAARAARLLREEVVAGGVSVPGVTIRLEKHIPAGAGLGGGSSNAAATLLGLKKLWKLDMPASRIAAIGAEIGSDVPLFLTEPERLIVMRGRGEKIELFGHSLLSAHVVLAIPPIHSPTGGVYKRFDELPAPPKRPSAYDVLSTMQRVFNSGPERRTPVVFGALEGSAPTPSAIAWSSVTNAQPGTAALGSLGLFNDLQAAAEDLNPGLREFRTAVEKITGHAFLMTGSGAAYFTIFTPSQGVAAEMTCTNLRTSIKNARFAHSRMI